MSEFDIQIERRARMLQEEYSGLLAEVRARLNFLEANGDRIDDAIETITDNPHAITEEDFELCMSEFDKASHVIADVCDAIVDACRETGYAVQAVNRAADSVDG